MFLQTVHESASHLQATQNTVAGLSCHMKRGGCLSGIAVRLQPGRCLLPVLQGSESAEQTVVRLALPPGGQGNKGALVCCSGFSRHPACRSGAGTSAGLRLGNVAGMQPVVQLLAALVALLLVLLLLVLLLVVLMWPFARQVFLSAQLQLFAKQLVQPQEEPCQLMKLMKTQATEANQSH